MREKFYWAILSGKLTKYGCQKFKAKSLVSRKNLRVVAVDGKYRVVRRIYYHEFHGDIKWRRLIRDRQHRKVLRWLRKAKRKESR